MTTSPPLPSHLVVVCGHGIWRGGPARGHDEAEWLIESYKAGETPTFIEHIKAGIQALADDERAVVAFSGGPTRKETPLSEARSYANLAAANDYFGLLPDAGDAQQQKQEGAHPLSPIPLHRRILVEEQALDSYYNILFSLVAFWRHVHELAASTAAASSPLPASSAWPARLTIVSHAFKLSRLVDCHCGPDAIGFLPIETRVAFIGINPPNLPAEFGNAHTKDNKSSNDSSDSSDTNSKASVSQDKQKAMAGAHTVVDHWTEDPHGVGDLLAGKRRARNPWKISQLLFVDDEERQRSRLRTRMVGIDMEALDDDGPRPWNS
ncbi:uncharacterized protein SPSK_04457 [Sporothrix schenckii 1099-18]|uniref:DUF218 domain-containing protein n=2 Tax=Sporothrix schenckii TaxID=29908 RepID=U7PUZ8_SPOS1|nr:uncharacterized protein SPSK_04457 [Sporothrix schenckii 1099-18]ERS99387.1 hypothetical protein HMPREF1624_04587 [Sporothrix schenckii ATCC 58251]KJR82894.1 hypothetical protein SPSK_04457 [Sporothrix schenckii 1099-18]